MNGKGLAGFRQEPDKAQSSTNPVPIIQKKENRRQDIYKENLVFFCLLFLYILLSAIFKVDSIAFIDVSE